MKTRMLILLLLIAAVAFSSGCVTGENMQMSKAYAAYRKEVDGWSYAKRFGVVWKDWLLDLSDVCSVELCAGEGLGLDLQFTKLGEVGALFQDVGKIGWRNRAMGYYREKRKEGGLTWFYYRDLTLIPITGTPSLFKRELSRRDFAIRHNDDWHWADVGFQAHLLLLGATAHVSPKQTVDFALNTLTLPYNLLLRPIFNLINFRPPEVDLMDDDTASLVRKKHELILIENPKGFIPAEKMNDIMRLP